jgi:hypothetical protein
MKNQLLKLLALTILTSASTLRAQTQTSNGATNASCCCGNYGYSSNYYYNYNAVQQVYRQSAIDSYKLDAMVRESNRRMDAITERIRNGGRR